VNTSKIVIISLINILFLSTVSYPHDSWLVPDTYRMKPGETVTISANTGMDFPKSLNAISTDRIDRFFIVGMSGTIRLGNFEVAGNSTRATCIPGKPGTYTAALALMPKLIKLAPEEFNRYLLSDGMKNIYELRKREGTLNEYAIESYSKYPKTILQVGDKTDDSCLKPVNLPVEIVPESNPYTLNKGDKLVVTALFMGEPLAGWELSWSYPGHGESFAGTVITGKDGRAAVPLEKSGPTVLRFTHMMKVNKKTHNWESHWASLTFDVADNR